MAGISGSKWAMFKTARELNAFIKSTVTTIEAIVFDSASGQFVIFYT